MNKPVFFIDDDEIERRSCADVLKELFDGSTVEIVPQAPLPTLADYAELVAGDKVAAFILDEKLTTSNTVSYTGAELAEHLRGIGGDRPIFIFTNFADESFSPREWAFENVVSKKAVLHDPHSPAAQAFRARRCRCIEYANELRAEAEQKYHALLVKSASGSLSPEEKIELHKLEERRIAPVAAAEREKQKRLDVEIENLKRLLNDERMF